MGNLGGTATTEVDVPIADVWAAIEDVVTAPQWQNGLLRLDPVEHDDQGRPTLVETENDAKVRTIKSNVRFEYTAPTLLEWNQEKGELKSLYGKWELEDLGEGRTRVTYQLKGDPGRMLGMLVRGPVEGYIRSVLVEGRPEELKDWLKTR
ncbi:MAG: hypothetical protein QOG62_24 [Thermoleophilaceae bacterium]|jgi:carbon monoxide dehydrogenase subunit G|nr:hypothetical protein [Thermoleophilaceae bacterium]